MKIFVEKACLFTRHTSDYRSKVTPKRAVYMAQIRTFSAFSTPRAVFAIHTIFCCFRNRYGAKLLVRNIPHTHSVISIDIFLKCDIMLL